MSVSEEVTMKVEIINFGLEGVSEAEFAQLCDELAPAVATVPGLVSKVWLRDSERGVFGGVYTWRGAEDLEAFRASDLYRGIATHANLVGITDRDFDVFESPTKLCRGWPEMVSP